MRIALILLFSVAAAFGQLRSVEIHFTGIECASCLESLPARVKRMRGVESAVVDAARQTLTVRLAASNRVRLEQLRDAIEQDGTKAREATIAVQGALSEEPGGRWLLSTPDAGSRFALALDGGAPSAQYAAKAGAATVSGSVSDLKPAGGTPFTLTPTSITAE